MFPMSFHLTADKPPPGRLVLPHVPESHHLSHPSSVQSANHCYPCLAIASALVHPLSSHFQRLKRAKLAVCCLRLMEKYATFWQISRILLLTSFFATFRPMKCLSLPPPLDHPHRQLSNYLINVTFDSLSPRSNPLINSPFGPSMNRHTASLSRVVCELFHRNIAGNYSISSVSLAEPLPSEYVSI